MPSAATSPASVFRNAVAPARAVFDRISVGIGWRTEIDVMATIRPHLRDCIAGTAAWHIATIDSRFSSRAGRYRSSGVDANVPAGGPPAFGTRMSTDPSASAARATNSAAPAGVLMSATRPTALPPSRATASSTRLCVAAADRDPHALRRQRRGRRETEPGRRRRHRRGPS